MIESHYSLNIALNGSHYARLNLPSNLTEGEAQIRARFLGDAIQSHDKGWLGQWSFGLMLVNCTGHDVIF